MTTVLSLHGKGLKLDTAADVEPHLTVDPAIVEEVHFGGNTIGIGAAEAIANYLSKTTKLKVANFADIFTGRLITEIPQALSAICDALKDKTSLVEINLSDNAFGGRVADPMVPFLTHNRSFSILKLSNNGLGPIGGNIVAEALHKSAQLSAKDNQKSNLRTVICGRNRLEDGSAPAFAEAFAAHGTMEHVSIKQCGIRQDGMVALAKGLAKNPNLRILDLEDNAINVDGSDEGTKAFADALPSWPNLEILNLSDCVLANEGEVPAIFNVLAEGKHTKLHTIQLQNDNLDAESFKLLTESVVPKLPALRRLELQMNEVEEDDEVAEDLKDAVVARGGKLLMEDEDEEEKEDQDKAEEPEPEKTFTTAGQTLAHKTGPGPAQVDKAADALADLLGKVSLGRS